MGALLVRHVLRLTTGLTPRRKLALVALADVATDGTGHNIWPSRTTLATQLECSVSTAHRTLRWLEQHDWIRRRGTHGQVVHYTLNLFKLGVSRQPDLPEVRPKRQPNQWQSYDTGHRSNQCHSFATGERPHTSVRALPPDPCHSSDTRSAIDQPSTKDQYSGVAETGVAATSTINTSLAHQPAADGNYRVALKLAYGVLDAFGTDSAEAIEALKTKFAALRIRYDSDLVTRVMVSAAMGRKYARAT